MGWEYLVYYLIATAVVIALTPKPKPPKAAALEDFSLPVAEEGRPVPVVFGTVSITGSNVLWYGDLDVKKIKQSTLFSSQTVGFKYFLGVHFGLCHGPVDALTTITIGDKAAFTGNITGNATSSIAAPTLFGGKKREGGVEGEFAVAMGGAAQAADTYLAATIGGTIPAFRGITCVIWRGGYIGNSPYPKPWAFKVRRILKGWTNDVPWYSAKAAIGTSANPAHIIYECLTNAEWGMGVPSAYIDEANFQAAADDLYDEGFGLDLIWNQQATIEDFIRTILDHVGGILTFRLDVGQYQLKLVRGDYTPASLPLYDETKLVALRSYQRQGWGETVNELTLTYTDPATDKDATITVQDLGNISAQGRIAETVSLPAIRSYSLAKKAAVRELQARALPVSKVEIEVDRSAWNVAQGDLFRLSWDKLDLSELVYRVIAIRKGSLEAGTIYVSAVEDVFSLAGLDYAVEVPAPGAPTPPADPDETDTSGLPTVFSASYTSPPGSPADGDRYLVPIGASGDWSGQGGTVAEYDAEAAAWTFYAPGEGEIVFDQETSTYLGYTTAGGWRDTREIPPDGDTGQVLAKASDADFDVGWQTPRYIPDGGSIGQVLTKTSGADFDVGWQDGGGGGSAGDPFFGYVVSLLHFDGDDASTRFADSSGNIWTPAGQAQLDDSQIKHGSASLLLDGSGDSISTPSSSRFALGNNDFTIEAWIRLNATGALQGISSKRNGSAGGTEHTFYVNDLDELDGGILSGGSYVGRINSNTGTPGGVTLTTGQWYHVALVRRATNLLCFVDGSLVDTVAVGTASAQSNAALLYVGRDGFSTGREFNGWIDEYRFTNGWARYTASFTPPVAAFPDGF